MSYTFLQIITAVKEEGRVNTSTDLDATIKRIVNEAIAKYSRNKEFPELFVQQEVITITSDAQSQFSFPVGRKITEVIFSSDGTYYYPLKKRNQYPIYSVNGFPTWYYRAGANIVLLPYDSILTTHYLKVSYYQIHPVLVNDADTLLVDDLYPIVLNETLGRLRRFHDDYQGATQYKQDAVQAASLIDQ